MAETPEKSQLAMTLVPLCAPRTLLLPAAPLAATPLSGCGSGSDGSPEFARIQDTGATLTPEMLLATGFRESKSYAIEVLPGASAAMFGFWRAPGRDPLDFEVRFYESWEQAVEPGTVRADEGTGEDAVLDESSAMYREGVRDRRTTIGSGEGGGARSGAGPQYADLVIYNNLIILCPGGQLEQSHERCAGLIDALEAS